MPSINYHDNRHVEVHLDRVGESISLVTGVGAALSTMSRTANDLP